MNIQRVLLHLYPRAWRERYADEVLALIEQRPLSFGDGLNLLFGALDAQLHPHLSMAGMPSYERTRRLVCTLRCSLLTVFCAVVGFILAGGAFQKMIEYEGFHALARTHGLVGLSLHLVVIGAVVALLAVVAGGLPIGIAVIRSALARRRCGSLLLLVAPLLALVLFRGTSYLLQAAAQPGGHPALAWHMMLARGLFFGALLAAVIAGTTSVCLAVARSECSAKFLRFALFPAVLAASALALILVATIIWGLGVRDDAPRLFAGNEGFVGSSTAGTWLGIITAQALATLWAAIAVLRGLSARTALRAAPW